MPTDYPQGLTAVQLETVRAPCISENKLIIPASLDSRCPHAIMYLLPSPTDETEEEKKQELRKLCPERTGWVESGRNRGF